MILIRGCAYEMAGPSGPCLYSYREGTEILISVSDFHLRLQHENTDYKTKDKI